MQIFHVHLAYSQTTVQCKDESQRSTYEVTTFRSLRSQSPVALSPLVPIPYTKPLNHHFQPIVSKHIELQPSGTHGNTSTVHYQQQPLNNLNSLIDFRTINIATAMLNIQMSTIFSQQPPSASKRPLPSIHIVL